MKTEMVTAGPTREAIDPVRFLSNRSSGRMGYAIAEAAAEAGAEVILISGPTALAVPDRLQCVAIITALEMREAVMSRVQEADIFIAAAAVADYRYPAIAPQKIKKTGTGMTLTLEPTPDILAEVAALPQPPFTVGFAAETEHLLDNARRKLQEKHLDMIAANRVGEGQGFDREENALQLIWLGGELLLETAPKERLARSLIRVVAERFHEKNTAQGS